MGELRHRTQGSWETQRFPLTNTQEHAPLAKWVSQQNQSWDSFLGPMHLIRCNQETFMSTWGHKFYSYLLHPAASLHSLHWSPEYTVMNFYTFKLFQYSIFLQLSTVATVKLNIEILLTQNINLNGAHWRELCEMFWYFNINMQIWTSDLRRPAIKVDGDLRGGSRVY